VAGVSSALVYGGIARHLGASSEIGGIVSANTRAGGVRRTFGDVGGVPVRANRVSRRIVGAFSADECNEPRYNPQMVVVEKITPGAIGRGTRFRAETVSRGRTNQMMIELTE
jgi:hypothetical protein